MEEFKSLLMCYFKKKEQEKEIFIGIYDVKD